jgi:RIO kinase 1
LGQNKDAEQLAALDEFIEGRVIAEVVGVIKSGKEATVYCCRPLRDDTGLIAAKVYRDRDVRRFSNDAPYMEGRMRGMRRREQLAIATKSRAGRRISFGHWVDQEWRTLSVLYQAGCDVPRPLAHSGRVILMEYIGDEGGAAPPLSATELDPAESERVFNVLMRNIEVMLACDRVHADLSPFNVLYRNGDVRIIDFPQAIDPRFNSSALSLLERDVERICQYAARSGIEADAQSIVRDLWSRFLRSQL